MVKSARSKALAKSRRNHMRYVLRTLMKKK